MSELVHVGTWGRDGVRCEMMHQRQLRIEAMRVVITEVVVLKVLAQGHVSEALTVEGGCIRVTCSELRTGATLTRAAPTAMWFRGRGPRTEGTIPCPGDPLPPG